MVCGEVIHIGVPLFSTSFPRWAGVYGEGDWSLSGSGWRHLAAYWTRVVPLGEWRGEGVERGWVERGGVEQGGVERGGVKRGGVERGGWRGEGRWRMFICTNNTSFSLSQLERRFRSINTFQMNAIPFMVVVMLFPFIHRLWLSIP